MEEPKTTRNWPKEVKEKAVQELMAGQRIADVAAKYAVPQKTVTGWKYQAKKAEKPEGGPQTNRYTSGDSPFLGHASTIVDDRPGPTAPKAQPSDLTAASPAEIISQFRQAWDALDRLMPCSPLERDAVERIVLRAKGFLAGFEYATNGAEREDIL